MVDPNEDTAVTHFPAFIVNGTKCAKITPKDVYSELEYWQTSVICSVLGANPPLEGMDYLGEIGRILGIPIKTDQYTMERRMLKYARLLIDIPLDALFPDYVEVPVSYEWKPLKCTHCHMYGHLVDECRKKKKAKKVWQPVLQKEAPEIPSQPSSNQHQP
ncbi:hypothetical protein Cgig2_013816 [Carnegiea gigantea]|uniref:Uncharacterized protein n=1 Tax=Carnegiea gigantea TaxID=171969 RepID=A0A9Q1GNJ1_9CARY|nr:hypothetical protein Cgig2_013816 [Carnegiea gigantea]